MLGRNGYGDIPPPFLGLAWGGGGARGWHSCLGLCEGGHGGQQGRGPGDMVKPRVIAGGGWLGERKVQTGAGQVPAQPCL